MRRAGRSSDDEPPAREVLRRAQEHYGVDYPIDVQRWFQHAGCGGNDYVIGNPHTFRGLVAAYCPHEDLGFTISAPDIDAMSPLTRTWLDGYLAGAEPQPEKVFGAAIHDVGFEDERWVRWQQLVRDFRASGLWLLQDWWDPSPLPAEVVLPARPWVLRGAEVWSWRGQSWVRAEPRPAVSRGFLVGSVCELRDDHDSELTAISDQQWVCADCGHLTESA